jgi:ABC-2 type transport system permease protein
MKLLSVLRKSLREQMRDILALGLTLAFAPCMVLLYWLFFPSGSTTYTVLVINNDTGAQMLDGRTINAGQNVVEALKNVRYKNGAALLIAQLVADRAAAEQRLRNRDAAALIILPPNFSRALAASLLLQTNVSATVTLVGDLTNPYYSPVAAMSMGALDSAMQAATGWPSPIRIEEEALGASGARTEFETYVPGLLIFAVIMLVFQAAMSIASEVEAGTLRRLQLTRMTAFDFLGGTGAALVVVGVIALLLAFATAVLLGFESQGPLWLAIAIGAVTSVSVVGIGLLTACFCRTVNQAFLLANFPLAILMFFSGSVFPLPRVTIFTLAGHSISPYDILPATHAVAALHKVLTLGRGLGDVTFELAALVVLTVVYTGAGVWLFKKRHMRAQ